MIAGCCTGDLTDNLYVNDVLNIGGEKEVKIIDLAKIIIQATNSSSKIIHLPPLKEGDMTRRCPDNSKMKKILNRELITMEEGVQRLLSSEIFKSLQYDSFE